MVLAGARRSLPSFINRGSVTEPDILGITALPCAGMAVLNAVVKPSLNRLLPVPRAYAGVRARLRNSAGKAWTILVIWASNVPAVRCHLLQIKLWRRGLHPCDALHWVFDNGVSSW